MRPAELSDDEIAVADLLLRMADYVNGGEVAYSLAEACQVTVTWISWRHRR